MALNKDKITKAADKHIRANRIEKAIAEYETWLKENPRDWNTVRQVGDLYHRIGRNDEATKKYALVADHYKRDGFNVRAIATHKMILRLDSSNEEAMRNLAELQAEEGLLMEAKSHYQALVELYTKRGHKRLAAEVFKKLTEIDPQDVRVRHKYAEFLNKQGKADEASREYVGIADQFIGQGLVDEAIKILERGCALATEDPALKVKLAHAHTLQGNHSESVRMLEDVRSLHPADPTVLGQLGEAYLSAGNNSEAETVFQKLRETEPDSSEHVLRIVDLRIAQGRLNAALEQLAPLVDVHVGEGDGATAAELLQKVLAKDPYHVKGLLKLAEVHTILKDDSARVGVYNSLCEAYHRAGDVDKAVQVAEQVVELEPEISQHKDRLNFLKSKLEAATPEAAPEGAKAVSVDPDADAAVDIDLGEDDADEFDQEITLEEEPSFAPPPEAAPDLGEVVELTSEDEENIKEKLTEAEVFVRYGLVDKAIAQLLDVLESFRFHAESRQKLIEVYRDQGMTREASEQLVQLGQVFDKLGLPEEASAAREDAAQINPEIAARAASAELAAQDELELTLSPETDSDLGDVGIELEEAAVLEDVAPATDTPELPASGVDDEIDVVIDDDSFRIDDEDPEPLDISLDISEEGDEAIAAPAAPSEVEMSDEDIVIDDVPDLDDQALDATDEDADVEEIAIALEDVEDIDVVADDEPISVDGTLHLDESSSDDLDLSLGEDPDGVGAELTDTDADSTIPISSVDDSLDLDSQDLGDSSEDLAVDMDDDEFPVELADEELLDPGDGLLDDDSLEAPELDISAEDLPPAESLAAIETEEAVETEEPIDIALPAVDDEPLSDAAPVELPTFPDVEETDADATMASSPEPPEAEGTLYSSELEEVDEYIALGLYEDARDTLRELLKRAPDEDAIKSKIGELGFSVELLEKPEEASEQTQRTSFVGAALDANDLAASVPAGEAPEPPAEATLDVESLSDLSMEADDIQNLVDSHASIVVEGAGGGEEAAPGDADSHDAFIDLATELTDDIFGTHSVMGDDAEPEGPLTDPGLDQIFKEFRKGVEKQLGTEDYDTRYNLGIAYKEMGLLDEAIAEFQLAAKDEVRGLECCSMLGLCFLEKGMPDIAVKWFTKGLELPGRREEEYHGLQYDLGQAHEAAGRPEQALELYKDIYKENARFRDVTDRVRELQAAAGK